VRHRTGCSDRLHLAFLKGVGIGVHHSRSLGLRQHQLVWWIGIGHAGTLISAILLLFKQTWRNSINRFAEAMTSSRRLRWTFPADSCWPSLAGLLVVPVPNTMTYGRQFRSRWLGRICGIDIRYDFIVFWYIGMVPASVRCATGALPSPSGRMLLSLGWRG